MGVFTPCNRREGFEVFDLALRLDDHVLWREAVAGLGKEPDERGLIVAVRVGNDGIRAAFHLSLRRALYIQRQAGCSLPLVQSISTGYMMLTFPVHTRNFNSSRVTVAIALPAKTGEGRNESVSNVETFSFDGDRRTKRHEESFVLSVFIAAIFVSEDSQPASALRSRGQIHAPHRYSTALFGGK